MRSQVGLRKNYYNKVSRDDRIPAKLFQILKDDAIKCCAWDVSKLGKLSSGQRTRKGQVSFQSQRRAMPNNVQTIVQLCSFHMLARLCSKSFKLGFSSTWNKNFQIYKLDLEKAEKAKIKLSTFTGSWGKQGSSRETSTFASILR